MELYLHSIICLQGVSVKHRDNFTFTSPYLYTFRYVVPCKSFQYASYIAWNAGMIVWIMKKQA